MKKSLVAYFSATAVTKHVAEELAAVIDADLFEIAPEKIYTKADLDWTNNESRSTIEMQNKNCRPKIESRVRDLKKYDVIFLGFPIWWYREPSIIDTFVESHNFEGKTIVPFATSGGSDIEDTYKNIKALAPKAKVEKGKLFDAGVEIEDLQKWAKRYL